MIYVPNMPHATKPMSVGWQFSSVMLRPVQPSSWVGVQEQRRISTEQSAIGVGIDQLGALLPLIKRPVIVLADRRYAVGRFVCACRELGCAALIRLKCNRKLYRAAPPRKEKQRGAPCKHGYRFLKLDVLWTRAHLRTPEQVERWIWIVACACNLLLIRKQLGLTLLRPWES
jgi:hypothetical protein